MPKIRNIILIAILLVAAITACSKSPESVVESYLKAKDWQERLKYVLDPDRVRPLMEKRYSNKYEPFEKFKVNASKQIKDQWVEVEVLVSGKNIYGAPASEILLYYLYLQKTSAGYKIDWEASIGHNSMTTAAFKAQKPKEPIKFRVKAKLSNNFFSISNVYRNSLWSVELKDSIENLIAYGYIEKELEDGKRLYEVLKDGEEHRIILIIKYPKGMRPDDDVVLIDKFVYNGWLEN
jgi:hypothetical protein